MEQVEDPTKGLPEEVFLFATEITPMVNVDLLVRDREGRVLLSWRNDRFYEQGWHVPGGILRLKESFDERIQRTALSELGSEVEYCREPLEIVPIISKDMRERGHFISFVYDCRLPEDYQIDNTGKSEGDAGYLKWHALYPANMLRVHTFYKKYFRT